MKKIKQLMPLLLLAAATHYSCINDSDVAYSDEPTTDSNGNLALFLEIPNVDLTRSAESSGTTETGSAKEYSVKSLTIYLFDKETKTLKGYQELKNISQASVTDNKVQYTADKITVNPGTYNIFAIANGKAIPKDFSTQDAFLNAVDDITYREGKISNPPDGGFVMTNRGAANLNVEVGNPSDTEKVTTVHISLERVVAKIEVSQKEETFPLKDTEDKVYCTIKISNFKMLNLATKFYTFRHTAVLNELQEPGAYTDENFGSISENNGYVIDPYFFQKTMDGAGDFKNTDGFFAQALVDPNIENNDWAGMSPAGSWSHIYCLENCMFVDAQKNGYTTGVMFNANMEINPERVFDENGNKVNVSTDWPTKIFYFNYNFYTSVNAIRKQVLNKLPEDINDNSEANELAKYSIKYFIKSENYSCYYNYWIKHEDNKSADMGVMEFGIVRNNIYRLLISKVAGLGSGDPFIDPDQPDENKAELDINIDVFPWAVRNQDVELE